MAVREFINHQSQALSTEGQRQTHSNDKQGMQILTFFSYNFEITKHFLRVNKYQP